MEGVKGGSGEGIEEVGKELREWGGSKGSGKGVKGVEEVVEGEWESWHDVRCVYGERGVSIA